MNPRRLGALAAGAVLVAATVAHAGKPSAAHATALAQNEEWETLYLEFAQAKPSGYGPAEREAIARATAAACSALAGSDEVLAFSLGELAVAFANTPERTLCAASAARASQQLDSAEALLRGATAAAPRDGRLALEWGRVLAELGEFGKAQAAWRKVPKASPEFAQAQSLLATTGPAHTPASSERPVSGRSFESSVDAEGLRVRGNAQFRFRYFGGQRDFGQRAEYEGRVQAALEAAAQASTRYVGRAREAPLDVILYTRAEFAQHLGPWAALAVAGVYSNNAIRLNDSAELNAAQQATLVHEYLHGVVDELTGFHAERLPVWLNEGLAEWVEWQFEGGDAAPVQDRAALRGLALTHSLPSLGAMRQDPLVTQRNPRVAYAYAAMAVRAMAAKTSVHDVVALIREVGSGVPFDRAFLSHFGRDLAAFEEGLASDFKSER